MPGIIHSGPDQFDIAGHHVPIAVVGIGVSVVVAYLLLHKKNPSTVAGSGVAPIDPNATYSAQSGQLAGFSDSITSLQGAYQDLSTQLLQLRDASLNTPAPAPAAPAPPAPAPAAQDTSTPSSTNAPVFAAGQFTRVYDPGWQAGGYAEQYYTTLAPGAAGWDPAHPDFLNEIAAKAGTTPQALEAINPSLKANMFPTPGTRVYVGSGLGFGK